MIILTVNNSISSISGLTDIQFRDLRHVLSYKETTISRYMGGFSSTIKYLMDKKGYFPTGLISRVQNWQMDRKLPIIVKDLRIVPKISDKMFNLNLGQLVPYPEQLQIAEKAKSCHRGTISACTGFGKSIAIALTVNSIQVRTLIVVSSLELKTQLKESFTKIFGNLDNITIENIGSKNLLNSKEKYDCLIVDEAHHAAAKTYRKLNTKYWNGIYYRFFFTATAFRAKSEEQILLESVTGDIIYTVTFVDAVENSYIVPLEAYFVQLKNIKIKGNGKNYASMYSELVVNREDRNDAIVSVIKNFVENNISALILVKQISHGDILQNKLKLLNITVPFANGQDNKSNEFIKSFSDKKVSVLIASSIVGEGVDTRACEWVVLAGGPGKSRGQLMQNCGRPLRKFPCKTSGKVLSFLDESHKWFTDHHKEFVKTIKSQYGVVPIKLEGFT